MDTSVAVHSVAEAYLFLMLRQCSVCDRGPVTNEGDLTKAGGSPAPWQIATHCGACGEDETLTFQIDPEPTPERAASNWINPTKERSRAIDLLGWLSLYRTIIAAADRETDSAETRRLSIECAQCLDEALKFYEADNDLPVAEAFFTDASRRRFRDQPQQFTRSRWLHERSKLPVVVFKTVDGPDRKPRRWWQLWRRRG